MQLIDLRIRAMVNPHHDQKGKTGKKKTDESRSGATSVNLYSRY
jgi:hypothetical protein